MLGRASSALRSAERDRIGGQPYAAVGWNTGRREVAPEGRQWALGRMGRADPEATAARSEAGAESLAAIEAYKARLS